ncbi:MAG: hypothetical protein ACLTWR_02245 [Agathobaculum desmolans]|uniref:hypothetical protein n=1 Tax=Agathobaculum desmolans TaxID=39484 RepID=UPI0039942BAA
MNKKDMTFEELRVNREEFLRRYDVQKQFRECQLSWDTLMEIGDDYENKCYGCGRKNQEYLGEYFEIIQAHIAKIASFENVHSYRFRIKRTGSLLAKIIRKSAERGDNGFTVENYFNKITDLLGIRILYVFKEDYWSVHQQIMAEYENQLAQDVSIKLKTGDDKDMYKRLIREYSNARVDENKIYRSIHYTIYAKKDAIDKYPRVEIQTRTIFEEGWSEINHKLVYKQNIESPELKKTSDLLSSMVGACDSVGTLMKMFYDARSLPDSGRQESKDEFTEETDNVTRVIRDFLLQK